MQNGGDMNHRFLALTSVTQHTLLYLAERSVSDAPDNCATINSSAQSGVACTQWCAPDMGVN
jgi:hypothetical protein